MTANLQQDLWMGSKLGKNNTFCEGKGENHNSETLGKLREKKH